MGSAQRPAKKDLPPKAPTQVKGGSRIIDGNDNITLVRGATRKATRKDLSAKSLSQVKAGGGGPRGLTPDVRDARGISTVGSDPLEV